MEPLPIQGDGPVNITVSCDEFGDWALFVLYAAQAIDQDGTPYVQPGEEENILVALQHWSRTGELPSKSLAAALCAAQAAQKRFLDLSLRSLQEPPDRRPSDAEVKGAAKDVELTRQRFEAERQREVGMTEGALVEHPA